MSTITIPGKLIKGDDLVIMPRREYERFLRALKKKKYTQLDVDLDDAIKEVKRKKTAGPFYSVEKLKESLEK